MSETESMLKELKEHAEGILAILEKMGAAQLEPSEAPISLSDIKALLMEKSRAGLNDEVHELIKSYGVEKLSAIDPSHYGELMKKAEGLKNG